MDKERSASKTEFDIVNNWEYQDRIYVSILCTTFNQQEYVRDAIESFLIQETKYRFEIIIHDDASTDLTPEILMEYKERYPSIIKLITQCTNQYSINRHIPFRTCVEASRGDFLALCEGDDYWITKDKIDKQIKALLNNSQVNFVITRGYSLFPNGERRLFNDLGEKKLDLDFCQSIVGPEKDFYPTASFFFRKSILDEIPEWLFNIAPVGDYYVQLFASYRNGLIYLPDKSIVYRKEAVGSYNSTTKIKQRIADDLSRIYCKEKIMSNIKFSTKERKCFRERIFKFQISILKNRFRQSDFLLVILQIVIMASKTPDLLLRLGVYRLTKKLNNNMSD